MLWSFKNIVLIYKFNMIYSFKHINLQHLSVWYCLFIRTLERIRHIRLNWISIFFIKLVFFHNVRPSVLWTQWEVSRTVHCSLEFLTWASSSRQKSWGKKSSWSLPPEIVKHIRWGLHSPPPQKNTLQLFWLQSIEWNYNLVISKYVTFIKVHLYSRLHL